MTETQLAVILARGLGTRMRAASPSAALSADQERAAAAGAKGLMPIGRPFLDYVISGLADAGIREVCLVVAPGEDPVRAHYASMATKRVRLSFAEQMEPKGTADAVRAAEGVVGDRTFLVLNCDNYYPVDAIRALRVLGASGLIGFDRAALVASSNIPEARVKRFALVESDRDGVLTAIHEKPSDLEYERLKERSTVSMNLWSFSPVIFAACARVQPSVRGELELQDAVRIARAEFGEMFRVIGYAGPVLDLSSREDVGEVTRRLEGVRVEV